MRSVSLTLRAAASSVINCWWIKLLSTDARTSYSCWRNFASWFAAAWSSASIVMTVPPTVAAGRESADPGVVLAAAVAAGAEGVVSALDFSFFANAGAVTAAVRSRIAVVFESVIGRISHARVARDRLLRRTGAPNPG